MHAAIISPTVTSVRNMEGPVEDPFGATIVGHVGGGWVDGVTLGLLGALHMWPVQHVTFIAYP